MTFGQDIVMNEVSCTHLELFGDILHANSKQFCLGVDPVQCSVYLYDPHNLNGITREPVAKRSFREYEPRRCLVPQLFDQ
jgi:hypothetical protein